MNLDPTFLSNILLVLTGFGGAFLAALWVSLVVWTYRDIRTRAQRRTVPAVHRRGLCVRGRGAGDNGLAA